MVAITVLMLVAGTKETMGLELGEDSTVEDVARLCLLPAQGLGKAHPQRLHVLLSGLLGIAKSSLRKCATGGTVFAHVRYLGEGAFGISVKIQTQAWAASDTLQEIFSGVVMDLEDEGTSWQCRNGNLVGQWQGRGTGETETGGIGTGAARMPDTSSQSVG